MCAKDELRNHPKVIDLTGQVFGMLTVKEFAGVRYDGAATWRCLCKCGNHHVVEGRCLRSGGSTSCGCVRLELAADLGRKLGAAKKRHGETGTRLHSTWMKIHQRCENPNNPAYPRYGGRGIRVHESFSGYEGFRDYILANLKHRKPGESLDRVDNDKGYEPRNLRWATPPQQARNRERNHIVTVFGETLCLAEAVEKWGVTSYIVIYQRIHKYGWPIERALLAPLRGQKNNSQPIKHNAGDT